jgi:hypothetical protein
VKDAINDYIVCRADDAVNPKRTGTKVAADHGLEIEQARFVEVPAGDRADSVRAAVAG